MFKKPLFDFWQFQKPFRHQHDEYGSKTSSDGTLNALAYQREIRWQSANNLADYALLLVHHH